MIIFYDSLIIQLQNQTMSLLSAGKQISVGNDKNYGRGLFIGDPDQSERKARKQQQYQEELRLQREEDRRRKQQQKRKEQEEDMRLEQKINEDFKKQSEKKNEKPAQKNDKNITNSWNKSQMLKSEIQKEEVKFMKRDDPPLLIKFEHRNHTETQNVHENNYYPKAMNLYQMEEERFYEDASGQKLRFMKQALEEKMNEVYNKIKQSRNLDIDTELDIIRKKINSSNNSYDNQNPKLPQFKDEYSQFYKIPKKQVYGGESKVKNLNYDSRVEMRTNKPMKNIDFMELPSLPQQNEESYRQMPERELASSHEERLWGKKKGAGNFLGNREAIDFQIQTLTGNIDNLLNSKSQY